MFMDWKTQCCEDGSTLQIDLGFLQFHDRSKPKLHFFFFGGAKVDKLTLKFIREFKGPRLVTSILKKKKRLEDTHVPISKTATVSYSHQDSVVLPWDRHIDQWDRMGTPEVSLYISSQLICDSVPRHFNSVRKEQSSTYDAETTAYPMQKIEVGLLSHTTYKNTNSKWIIN